MNPRSCVLVQCLHNVFDVYKSRMQMSVYRLRGNTFQKFLQSIDIFGWVINDRRGTVAIDKSKRATINKTLPAHADRI